MGRRIQFLMAGVGDDIVVNNATRCLLFHAGFDVFQLLRIVHFFLNHNQQNPRTDLPHKTPDFARGVALMKDARRKLIVNPIKHVFFSVYTPASQMKKHLRP